MAVNRTGTRENEFWFGFALYQGVQELFGLDKIVVVVEFGVSHAGTNKTGTCTVDDGIGIFAFDVFNYIGTTVIFVEENIWHASEMAWLCHHVNAHYFVTFGLEMQHGLTTNQTRNSCDDDTFLPHLVSSIFTT